MGSARMVMEKLKSWSALSNSPTTTAAAQIYVLKTELVRARVQSIPRGLKPSSFEAIYGTAKAVPSQNIWFFPRRGLAGQKCHNFPGLRHETRVTAVCDLLYVGKRELTVLNVFALFLTGRTYQRPQRRSET